ncbi:MAG: cytochrome c1, partial [Emcibacteraceae bacterium]|nr:cytochrome c1 [Emcibacteraceae bacterium]
MMKNIKIKGLMATMIGAAMIFSASNANAADTGTMHPERHDYTSAGIFGKFDLPSLQRGLQVYQEVCSGCHSVQHLSYRNLS